MENNLPIIPPVQETRYYLHLVADSVSPDDADQGWIKVAPTGWYKVKFNKATPFSTREEAKLALLKPVFTGITGALTLVKLETTILGRP